MFIKKYSQNEYPLYIFDKKKKKLLRQIVDESIKENIEKKLKELEKKKFFKKLFKKYNKNLITLFLRYHFREKIYNNVCHNIISDYLNKDPKIKNKELFKVNLKDIFKIFYTLIRVLYFLLKPFFLKRKKIKKYDIIVQYIYSNHINSKKDFPLLDKINKKIKTAHLISSKIFSGIVLNNLKKLKKNYITRYRINSLKQNNVNISKISKKTLLSFWFLLKNWFTKPYLSSLLFEFLIEYEYYLNLFKVTEAKVYVHALTYEQNIAPIRQALEDCKGKNIAFQRSYFDSNNTSYLQQPDEILFAWGKDIENNLDKKNNYIRNIIKTYPAYLFSKSKKIKKNKNFYVLSFFDTGLNDGGFISPDDYNKYLKIVLEKVLQKENIFLIMKYKYNFTNKSVSKSNNKMIKMLKVQGRCKEYDEAYVNNSFIIRSSDLVLSVNTISISAEALFHKVDSLSFCNKGYNDFFLKKMNYIFPFAYKNLNKIEEIFEKKIQKKLKKNKINKLHRYFFKKDLYPKHPKEVIESMIAN